ncbi:hypothetical protein HYV11_03050 [Candidatus Dependentiae bacterium]|nr:hypothetical protein [Candidatus Dependentiae bacterium]
MIYDKKGICLLFIIINSITIKTSLEIPNELQLKNTFAPPEKPKPLSTLTPLQSTNPFLPQTSANSQQLPSFLNSSSDTEQIEKQTMLRHQRTSSSGGAIPVGMGYVKKAQRTRQSINIPTSSIATQTDSTHIETPKSATFCDRLKECFSSSKK